jgi:DNA-directed RNA polymerase sigma subunit (sigma70/sigma32)
MAQGWTLIDGFDLSQKVHKDQLNDIIDKELDEKEQEIMNLRLGLAGYYASLLSVAKYYETDPDTVMTIETRVAESLKKRGVPRRAH